MDTGTSTQQSQTSYKLLRFQANQIEQAEKQFNEWASKGYTLRSVISDNSNSGIAIFENDSSKSSTSGKYNEEVIHGAHS